VALQVPETLLDKSFFLSTNATMHFMDSSATNYSRRFYRVVVP
jgi:hypothetical protein